MDNEQFVLATAVALQSAGVSHSQMHDAIYGTKGIATKLFKDKTSREGFAKSESGKKVKEILAELIAAENARSPGNLSVRMPSTLHESLKREAESENVSLNQLIVTKLSVSLKEYCG